MEGRDGCIDRTWGDRQGVLLKERFDRVNDCPCPVIPTLPYPTPSLALPCSPDHGLEVVSGFSRG